MSQNDNALLSKKKRSNSITVGEIKRNISQGIMKTLFTRRDNSLHRSQSARNAGVPPQLGYVSFLLQKTVETQVAIVANTKVIKPHTSANMENHTELEDSCDDIPEFHGERHIKNECGERNMQKNGKNSKHKEERISRWGARSHVCWLGKHHHRTVTRKGLQCSLHDLFLCAKCTL